MELQKKITALLYQERDRLVLWTPVWLAMGIGLYFSLADEPPLWPGAVVLAVAAPAAWLLRKRPLPRFLAVAAMLSALGFCVICLRTQWVAAPALYSTLYFRTVQGTIDDIEDREKGGKVVLSDISIERVLPQTAPRRIGVSFKARPDGLHVGDRIEVKAIVFPPPTPSMPGGYDIARQYYYEQIGATGFAPQPPVVRAPARRLGFSAWLTDLRLSINQRIMQAMSKEGGPVAAALMVGEVSAVSREVREAMRESGLYHVLSISGLHMSLAVGILYVTIRFLLSLYPPLALRWPVKKLAALAGLLGAFAYLLLSGSPVPAVRSFVMVACVMLAVLFDRRGISLYSLAWAATLILLVQPESLVGASFQLSFAATLGIVALYERYAHLLRTDGQGPLHRLRLYFSGLVATSLVAALATTPLVIYHFNRFTLWSIAANMLMMPLASLMIMPAAVLAFLMMPFGLEALPLSWLDTGVNWMIACARWFAAMPEGAFAVPSLTFGGLMLTVLGGLWLCLMAGRWRFAGAWAALLGMLSIALHQPYDLMVGGDGKKVALRMTDGRFVFLRGLPSGYDAENWLRYHGQEEGLKTSVLEKTKEPAASHAEKRECEGNWCVVSAYGKRIAIARNKNAPATLCSLKADIIVSDVYLDDRACQPDALVVDRRFLYRNGALGIRFDGGVVQLTAAEDSRHGRPWSGNTHYRLYHSDLYHSDKAAITEP